MGEQRPVNAFPERRVGLWRLRTAPHLVKEQWPGGDFGDRWRRVKATLRQTRAPERSEATHA